MLFSSNVLALSALASIASASLNTTQEYYLKTSLKDHQRSKGRFNDLYLAAYHTGAGLNDATFYSNISMATKGFLNNTAQEFDFGSGQLPNTMVLNRGSVTSNAWDPVRINAGDGQPVAGESSVETQGFSLNQTGLQWNSAPGEDPSANQFGGWLVCDWTHGVPQLFFRLSYSHVAAPCSCADVDLLPEYI